MGTTPLDPLDVAEVRARYRTRRLAFERLRRRMVEPGHPLGREFEAMRRSAGAALPA